MPLPSAQPGRARPQLSLDPQGEGKDRHRNLCHPGRIAKGTTRGAGLSPLSSTFSRVAGDQREDLPCSPRGTVGRGEKKTAEIIQQEVAREVEHLLRLVSPAGETAGPLGFETGVMAVCFRMHNARAARPPALP